MYGMRNRIEVRLERIGLPTADPLRRIRGWTDASPQFNEMLLASVERCCAGRDEYMKINCTE
jgi:hypothetical protein